ncbi:MAG: HD domain-containing protein [Planctomycetota bacterium]
MIAILSIPEVACLDGPSNLIRIPNQTDVPLTPRVMRLIDTLEFQRLKGISQLGMVSFVYPGATHNRFEHSLGVYRNSLLFLRQLGPQPEFSNLVQPIDAEKLILAALFHDIGHWPFCHPIEDIALEGLPAHEDFAKQYVLDTEVANLIQNDWKISPKDVLDLIIRRKTNPVQILLGSILSGPIDIDKMDYLYRDSLHAGVPYGQNFDAPRLIRSLCLNSSGDRLAITRKGQTAAELMVFARYVMFSEVYWHHAVRSATAMFQRAFFLHYQALEDNSADLPNELLDLFQLNEWQMTEHLRHQSPQNGSRQLFNLLFGTTRQLFKRVANFNSNEHETIYRQVAQKPYVWLVEKSRELAMQLGRQLNQSIEPWEVLIDAPPVGLEVQFQVDVRDSNSNQYKRLGDVSPVVETLAQKQFDDFVKRVRIFVSPRLIGPVKTLDITSHFEQVVYS